MSWFDLRLQVETMFEKYNFSGVFIQIQAVLSLYAQGAYEDNWRINFCLSICVCIIFTTWHEVLLLPFEDNGSYCSLICDIQESLVKTINVHFMYLLLYFCAYALALPWIVTGLLTGLVIDSGDGVTHVVNCLTTLLPLFLGEVPLFGIGCVIVGAVQVKSWE